MASSGSENDRQIELPAGEKVFPAGTGLSEAGIQAMQGTPEAAAETGMPAETQETRIIGDPERDAQFWHQQQHDDTCAIVAQEGIIEKHTGLDPGEEALRDEARRKGWYTPGGGTFLADTGNLLDAHSIPTTRWDQADLETLQRELEQGRDVVAAVDAGYLWQDPDYIGGGHAVWVTGLETNDLGDLTGVFLNDSGNQAIGGGGRVPVEVFRDAWAATNNFMVSTQDPSPLVGP